MKENITFGGEFEIKPSEMFPITDRQPILLRSGRIAFRYILEKEEKHKKVLMPAYMCDSLLYPLFELNIKIEFYPITHNLTIDIPLLFDYIRESGATLGLFINYFGFPILTEDEIELIKCEFPYFKVILDFTHGSLLEFSGSPKKTLADYCFSSLRKYTDLPDGCIILPNVICEESIANSLHSGFFDYKVLAKNLRAIYLMGLKENIFDEDVFLRLSLIAEKILDKDCRVDYASQYSNLRYQEINFKCIGEQRRKNYKVLLKRLNLNSSLFGLLYSLLPNNVSPFVFPIVFKSKQKRDVVRRLLIEEKVFCPVLWPLLMDVDQQKFPASKYLAERILCIPIDQRYTEDEIEVLADRFISVLNKF